MSSFLLMPIVFFEVKIFYFRMAAKDYSYTVHHLDVNITWLAEQYDAGTVKLAYSMYTLMLVDCCTKPVSGDQLYRQISYMIGERFYPAPDTRHFLLLDLPNYAFRRNVNTSTVTSPLAS